MICNWLGNRECLLLRGILNKTHVLGLGERAYLMTKRKKGKLEMKSLQELKPLEQMPDSPKYWVT